MERQLISVDNVRPPTDFGDHEYPAALVNVTNVCNLSCTHCFVFRADNPNRPKDKIDDATMLEQLRVLRDRHHIKSMLFMGGEPMTARTSCSKPSPSSSAAPSSPTGRTASRRSPGTS